MRSPAELGSAHEEGAQLRAAAANASAEAVTRIALAQINPTVGAVRRQLRQGSLGARSQRGDSAARRRADGHARARAVRLSARGPAVPPRLPPPRSTRRSRALADAARGIDAARRLSRVRRRRASTTPRRWLARRRACSRITASSALPNYQVFDEKRYFTPGDAAVVVELDGIRIGTAHLRGRLGAGAGARPRRRGRAARRRAQRLAVRAWASRPGAKRCSRPRAKETGLPFVYVNMVGGQDELVFDGGSFVDGRGGRGRACARRRSRKISTLSTSSPRRRRLVPRRRQLDRTAAARRGERLQRARARRARLRRQERLPGRRARPVGRHRFGADARASPSMRSAPSACTR